MRPELRFFGAKFEEMLIIENGKASWLDDHVTHLQLPEGFY